MMIIWLEDDDFASTGLSNDITDKEWYSDI